MAIYILYIPEKGGRKPAPSRNLFVWPSSIFVTSSKKKSKKTHYLYIYNICIYDTTCLHVPFFSHLSLLCNPSPLLPRHHSSSPCKLSCSEPQRTLLSVELRELYFFNMLASMFLAFSKLCLSSFHAFFRPFPAFSYGFSRVSFLHFPHFPNGFLNFPWFFQACHSFFPPFYLFFSTIFLHFPPGSNDFPSFSLFFHTFFLPFSGDLGRIEPQPHQIA